MNFIDNILNSITMYRLVLYYLIFLLIAAFMLSVFGMLSFSPFALLFSIAFFLIFCYCTNLIFSTVFQAPTNTESVYISALILSLIITPQTSTHAFAFFFWVAVWAMASKYIVAINKKHIFNPVAFGVALSSLFLTGSASWWVGTASMLPFVLVGILIVRKIRRFEFISYFFVTAVVLMLFFSILKGSDLVTTLQKIILDTPLLFFSFIMMTEPLTTPPTRGKQSVYAIITGILFVPQLRIGAFALTPEVALLVGNVFSYFVGFKHRLMVVLQEKIQIAPDVYDFIFSLQKSFTFTPGQYLEWTLGHPRVDSRGNRRYFTIASSPTESDVRVGVKFYPGSSSFKKALLAMDKGSTLVASQLSGDFVLPKDPNQKLVFIAGGIGITPFRSMIQYLFDSNQKRIITLFYSNKAFADIVYKDVLDKAQVLGIETVYTLTDPALIPQDWKGKVGKLTIEMIKETVPDYKERMFYLSGPRSMVVTFEKTLEELGIKTSMIKIDYFPGFA